MSWHREVQVGVEAPSAFLNLLNPQGGYGHLRVDQDLRQPEPVPEGTRNNELDVALMMK